MALLYTLSTFSLDKLVPQFSSPPINMRPFLIQGATTGIPPGNPDRTNILYVKNKDTPFYSTTPSEYTTRQINTKNLILNDYCPGTTLVDMVEKDSPRYEFAFAAIHTNDLGTTSDANIIPHILSIVFINRVDIYHIQIPLSISSKIQSSDVNPFIRSWLNPLSTEKESFSINQLLSFKQTATCEFDRYMFTLKYNQQASTTSSRMTSISPFGGKYTLCIFKTPQFVLDYEILAVPNDLPTFNDIFNYVMRDQLSITDPRFPLALCSDVYMLSNGSTQHPKASFYTIPTQYLTQLKLSEGFTGSCNNSSAGRMLDSVKCYPIDLASQVDANGNIFIDETSAKPIDIRPSADVIDSPTINTSALIPSASTTQFYFNLFLVLITVIILSMVLFLLVYYVFVKRSNPMTNTVPPAVINPSTNPTS